MSLDAKQFLFIIGSPRSGTTMLQILLGSHPQVATTVELTLFSIYVDSLRKQWEKEKEFCTMLGGARGLPALWNDADMDSFLRDFLQRAYAKLIERFPHCTHLLDKNPTYGLHVHEIRHLLPQAKFIHIIRDGRDVAVSLIAAKSIGFRFSRAGDAAKMWRDYVRGALEAARYGDDYLELRYEDFVGQQMPLYRRVLDFAGLPADDAWIAKTLEENTFEKMKSRSATADSRIRAPAGFYGQGKAGAWVEAFTARDRYDFHHVAGNLLCELGYAQPDWWAESALQGLFLRALPETRRRARVIGLGLTLLRRGLLGHRLPAGLHDFEG